MRENLEKREFAYRLGVVLGEQVNPTSVSQWAAGTHEPSREKVWAMESVLGMKPGTLSRLLGYLPVNARSITSVVEAIDADPKLGERERRSLKAAYRELAQP